MGSRHRRMWRGPMPVNPLGEFFFAVQNQKKGPLVNTMHAGMMRHPNAVEAAMRDAPKDTQLVGQYMLHKMQDARERAAKESGLPESEMVILGGHFAFNKRDGVRRYNDGWRVYARLQTPTAPPLRGGTNKDEPILPPETQKYLREQAELDERRRKELNGHADKKPTAPPPERKPEPDKESRRTLTLIETMHLANWLRDNFEKIAKSGDSKVKVAEAASKALKISISDVTIHRIAKELKLDWKVKVVRSDNNQSRASKKVILNTIRYLFDKLGEKLPQEFTDAFGE